MKIPFLKESQLKSETVGKNAGVGAGLQDKGKKKGMSSLTRIASSYSSLIHNDLDAIIKTFEVAVRR